MTLICFYEVKFLVILVALQNLFLFLSLPPTPREYYDNGLEYSQVAVAPAPVPVEPGTKVRRSHS